MFTSIQTAIIDVLETTRASFGISTEGVPTTVPIDYSEILTSYNIGLETLDRTLTQEMIKVILLRYKMYSDAHMIHATAKQRELVHALNWTSIRKLRRVWSAIVCKLFAAMTTEAEFKCLLHGWRRNFQRNQILSRPLDASTPTLIDYKSPKFFHFYCPRFQSFFGEKIGLRALCSYPNFAKLSRESFDCPEIKYNPTKIRRYFYHVWSTASSELLESIPDLPGISLCRRLNYTPIQRNSSIDSDSIDGFTLAK